MAYFKCISQSSQQAVEEKKQNKKVEYLCYSNIGHSITVPAVSAFFYCK